MLCRYTAQVNANFVSQISDMNTKTLLLALSLSLLNWILVYFLIEEITIYKYLLIEAITAISTLVYEYEKKKIQTKKA